MSHSLKGLIRQLPLLVAAICMTNSIYSTPIHNTKDDKKAAIVSRLQRLDLPLNPSSSDAHMQRKINEYLGRGGRSTERMLGRANQYFPVFEYYLAKHGMPASLKYLAVAESMLVPRAVSSASAAGLWQLMPVTAREMGLRVDGVVDERLDIYRSTEAAVIMLKDLYAQFGDWHLALAAYNCGKGRVRKAIRQAGGYTFYPKVKRFLPKETQHYVARYVAAAYAVNYYDDYGLTPNNLASVGTFRVYRTLSFYKVARELGINAGLLRRLNPSFVRGYIPTSERGYLLRVPQEDKVAIQRYVWGRPNLVELPVSPEIEEAVSIAGLAGFDSLATLFGCSAANFVYANPSPRVNALNEQLLLGHAEVYTAIAMN